MANIFITYGDTRFIESAKRIRKQAKKNPLFDEFIIYKPVDLPESLKASPLFAFTKGGGYWLWKPWIIWNTLQQVDEGDVVWYIDSGCTLNNKSSEWKFWNQILIEKDSIVFQYRDGINYGWEGFVPHPEEVSPRIIHWTKPSTLEYFSLYCGVKYAFSFNKIMGGIIICKKTNHTMEWVDEWLKISLFKPELVIDPFGVEKDNLPKTFNLHDTISQS